MIKTIFFDSNAMQSWTKQMCIAIGFILLLFYDVIFLNGSLQPSNFRNDLGTTQSTTFINAHPFAFKTDAPWGLKDIGATAWESEPIRRFVARSIQKGDMPYWNPYSASGALGPETLVDQKFSPLTLIGIPFSASAISYDFGVILIYLVAAFSLVRIVVSCLGLSALSAIAALSCFFMMGFSTANLGSQNAMPYFFAPLLLLSTLSFSSKPSALTWVGVVIAHALIFSITMVSVLVVVLMTVHIINIVYLIEHNRLRWTNSQIIKTVAGIFLGGIVAFLLVAPVWFPILEYLLSGDLAGVYGGRNYPHHSNDNLLSIFTPFHYWESYSYLRIPEIKQAGVQIVSQLLPHLGIVAIILAASIFNKSMLNIMNKRVLILALGALVIFSYARVFGFFPFNSVDKLPILKIISPQYWGAMGGISFSLLVAYAVQGLLVSRSSHWPIILTISLFLGFFFILAKQLGMPDHEDIQRNIIAAFIFLLLGAGLSFLMLKFNVHRSLITSLMVFLMIFELHAYMNFKKPIRYDYEQNMPGYINDIRDNIGYNRIYSLGTKHNIPAEYGSALGIRQISTRNLSVLRWYRNFYERRFGKENPVMLYSGGKTLKHFRPIPEQALDLLRVKYILVDKKAKDYIKYFKKGGYDTFHENKHTQVFENKEYMPIAFPVENLLDGEILPQGDMNDLYLYAYSNDSVLLEQFKSADTEKIQFNSMSPNVWSSSILSYDNTSLKFKMNLSKKALVVITEVWHPNWSAFVDGKPVHIGLVNESFRGLVLEAGEHVVELEYAPRSLFIANILFYFISLSLILIIIVHNYINRTYIKSKNKIIEEY